MALGIFKSKPKTYLQRNPAAQGIYQSLTPEQRKVLDEISVSEQGFGSSHEKLAIQRIIDEILVSSMPAASAAQLKAQAKMTFRSAQMWLSGSEITTNVNVSLFMNEAFLNGDGLKTIWNAKTEKGLAYSNTRQAVEENAFGYKIDWSVPLSRAAEVRPVYAGLNFSRHPYGAAVGYGSVALVYKSTVMHRCTFIPKDTFDVEFSFQSGTPEEIATSRSKICTAAQFGTLIAHLSTNQLKALCRCVSGQFVVEDFPPNYVEAHIHGGVKFSSDLAAIRIATSGQTTFEKEVGFFETKHNRHHARGAIEYVVATFARRFGVSARYYNRNRVVGIIA